MDAISANDLSPALALGLGLSMGLAHAFEPDHMSAVGMLASGRRARSRLHGVLGGVTRSSVLGAAWGAGHATTLVGFGLLAHAAAAAIQDWVFSGLEFAAGAMLVALGAFALAGRGFAHEHPHTHPDGTSHSHEHRHPDGAHGHVHRSYLIGLVHGLAGSGALVALASSTLAGLDAVAALLLAFGAGAAAGMCLAGGLLGASFGLAGGRMRRPARCAAGALGIALGALVMYQTLAPA